MTGPLERAQVPGNGGSVLAFRPAAMPDSLELRHLADRLGGEFGVLSHAGEEHPVLKVQDGLYAAAGKPSPRFKAAAAAREWDVHPVLKHADAGFFLADYRRTFA